ncbi:MAG: hypothetical protein JSS91_06845 [Bacteroidetes bacterium]|nr:hypothetical protein [Bacteroidota bacterium]
MKSSSELFDLIKSLSSSEKRYFRLSASVQKGNKKYLKLFDLLDSQKIFDERKLRSAKGSESIFRNYNFTKNYLGKLIFKSLLNYKNEKSTDAKLFNILQRCRILFDKALFGQYFKTVKAGRLLAEKNERFSFLLDFIEIERQLSKKEILSGMDINKNFDDELRVLEKISVINSYKRVIALLFRFYRYKGIVRSAADEEELNGILSLPQSVSGGKNLTVTSSERKLFLQSLASEIKGDFGSSFSFNKQRYRLILKNRNIFGETLFDNFKDSMLSASLSAADCGNFRDAYKIISELKSMSVTSQVNDININLTDLSIKILSALKGKTKIGIDTLMADAEKYLDDYRNKITINTFNLTVFRLSSIYFFEEKYSEALRIMEKFNLEKNSRMSPFIEPYSRMLLILINFELKKYKLLSYMIPTARKYLKSRNALHKTEYTVLNYTAKLIKEKKSADDNFLLYDLKNELEVLKKERFEKNAFLYFDYLRWIKNKLIIKK